MGKSIQILLMLAMGVLAGFEAGDSLFIVNDDGTIYLSNTPASASAPDSVLVKLDDGTIGTYPTTSFTGDSAGPVSRNSIVDLWDSPFWDSIPDKPDSFLPESHLHLIANVTGLTDSLSAHRTAIASKQNIITGAASTITSTDLTPSRVLLSNESGKVSASGLIDASELGYLNGVTSNIQTQIAGKEPAISTSTSDKFWNGLKQWVNITIGNVLGLNDTITNHRTAIASKLNISDTSSLARKNHGHSQSQITGLVDTVTAHRNAINNKQPLDTDLTTIAGLTHSDRHVIISNGTAWTRRALAEADLPSLSAAKITSGTLDNARLSFNPADYVTLNTTQTITGAKTFSANATFASPIIGSGAAGLNIQNNTVDGSDTKTLLLCGGGSYQSTRGATIVLRGNEYSPGYGNLELIAGDGNGTTAGAVRVHPRMYFGARPTNDHFWHLAFGDRSTITQYTDNNFHLSYNAYYDGANWRRRLSGIPNYLTMNGSGQFVLRTGSTGDANSVINPQIYSILSYGGNTAFGKNTFVGGYKVEVAGNALVEGKLDVGDVDSYGDFYLRNKMRLLNKAGNGWVDFITRNVSGSEAAADLSNVGSITPAGSALKISGDIFLWNKLQLINRDGGAWDVIDRETAGSGIGAMLKNITKLNDMTVTNGGFSRNGNIGISGDRVVMSRRNVGSAATINITTNPQIIDLNSYAGISRFNITTSMVGGTVVYLKNATEGDEIFLKIVSTGQYPSEYDIALGWNIDTDGTWMRYATKRYFHLICEGTATAGGVTANKWWIAGVHGLLQP